MYLRFFSLGLLLLCSLLSLGEPAKAQTSRTLAPEIAARRAQLIRSFDQLNRQNSSSLSRRSFTGRHTAESEYVKGGARILSGDSDDGSITGQVTGIDAGNEWAQVVAFSTDSVEQVALFATVKSDGSYVIGGLPAGDYYVVADAPGYQTQFYDHTADFTQAAPVTVADGSVTRNIDFSMDSLPVGSGSIAGGITRESDGSAIAGAMVIAWSLDNQCAGATTVSNDNGNYVLESLFEGDYIVFAVADGFIGEYFDNAVNSNNATAITVAASGRTSNIDFALGVGGSISGRVLDADGNPVPGAYVEALLDVTDPSDSPGFVFGNSATTDEDGYYTVSGLVDGEYIVHTTVWNWCFAQEQWYNAVTTPERATLVSVVNGGTRSGIDFRFDLVSLDGSISGTVTDTSGTPIAGAQMMAELVNGDLAGQPIFGFGFTDANGDYVIAALPDGEYRVSVYVENGWMPVFRYWPNAETEDDASLVSIEDGVTTPSAVTFNLAFGVGNASISGTVSMTDDSPLAGAMVYLLGVDPSDTTVIKSGYAVTDENGYYSVEGLFAGTYIAYAGYWGAEGMAEGWYGSDSTGPVMIELADAQNHTGIDITLDVRNIFGSIAGRITDRTTGAPIARAYVEVYPTTDDISDDGFGWMGGSAITDENGYYQIDELPEGDYTMIVTSNGAYGFYQDADQPEDADLISVMAGDTALANTSILARAEGTGVISGRVDDKSQNPIDMAIVMAIPSDFSLAQPWYAMTGSNGNYRIEGLPDGDYLVLAFSPIHIGEYYDNALDPFDATLVSVSNGGTASGINFNLAEMDTIGCGPTRTPKDGGIVYGRVTDGTGRGLGDATVYAVDAQQTPVAFTRSRADGSYDLAGLPSGSGYRVFASRSGYERRFNGEARSFSEAQPMSIDRNSVQVNIALAAKTSSADNGNDATTGAAISISGNRPNPFVSETSINFSLAKPMHVRLTVVNALGEKVAELLNGDLTAGAHNVEWNGRNGAGDAVESGVYFYRIENGVEAAGGTMTLTR